MKNFKIGLRIWIAFSSMFGFLAGWVMLAHSPKPVPPTQIASVPQPIDLRALPPLPSISQPGLNVQPLTLQTITPLPQTSLSRPRLRTGGS
jgi:hypothetical protein